MIKYAARLVIDKSGHFTNAGLYFALDGNDKVQFYSEPHWNKLYIEKHSLLAALSLHCKNCQFVIEEHYREVN
ncbi:hypothetical protein MA9V2_126 [Chryseobacterium phage MA9V-2]|nr:hypothetical protein MA9V2_126 [Chryseobacterium phage MA9V-2]